LRMLRAFRLTRYATSMNILFQVLRNEASVIAAALFVLLMLILVAASVTYLAEHTVQPEAFGSIPHALWWAVVTMTTIGYGDVVPQTVIGRLFAGVVGIISVGIVAVPAGILASGFSDALHQRRKKFEHVVEDILGNGHISDADREVLRHMQEELGLSPRDAALMLKAGYRRAEQSAERGAEPPDKQSGGKA